MYPPRPGTSRATPPPRVPRTPEIVFQPKVYQGLRRGIDLIANALRPTLGPLPRLVVVERNDRRSSPEILDDGGTIARRIIQVKKAGPMMLAPCFSGI